jgi:DNA end-binding protein Ku
VAPRAIWKGFFKVSELAFPIALYAAATTSERIAFHTVNRKTGNRVRREFIDEETERPVEREAQVKGYEVAKDQYILLEQEEIQKTIPQSDKTIRVEAFIPCDEVDTVYFDRPYFLAPSGTVANEAFAVLREGMRKKNVAAIGRAVLFRRMRTLLMQPLGRGFVANTMNFDYEVRPADRIFEEIDDLKIEGEMLELAK